MDIQSALSRQRIKHIVDSYHLQGREEALGCIDELMASYPMPAVELALVETLLQVWLTIPMPRGQLFFEQVRNLLQQWKASQKVETKVSMHQFQLLTGLDPTPIFGSQMPPQGTASRTATSQGNTPNSSAAEDWAVEEGWV